MHIKTSLSLLVLPLLAACSSTTAEPLEGTTVSTSQALTSDLRVAERDSDRGHERGHEHHAFRHVLLLSIDGLHQVDLARFLKLSPNSALAKLARHGVQYTNAFV